MEEDGYELFDTAHMSVTERLLACLRNETMTDVALVGDDGVPVPAARYILGSASAAFQPLLYGKTNRDSNCSTVNIQESNQKSLTALVEFCCSDELNTSIWAESHPLEIVQDTVALAKLAHTYGVPKLQFKVKEFLNPLMLAYPPLACSVFNLADPVSTPDVYAASLVILQEKAYVALKSSRKEAGKSGSGSAAVSVGGMICFSPRKLEDVLSDNEIEADELFLFQQLVAWRDHNDYKYTNVNGICKALVHHLDLSSIDPNEIETTVMQSGFVTADMLVKALMAQAKSATHEGLAFASLRGPRGKKFAHVLVQGAGDSNCNGVYVHVKREKINKGQTSSSNSGRNLLYFIKKPTTSTTNTTTMANQPKLPPSSSPPKTYILVQDSMGTWRICDSDKNILYECRDGHTIGTAEIPHTGWAPVTGSFPAPECSWLRPHPHSSHSNIPPPSPSRSTGSSSCSTVDFPLPPTSPQQTGAAAAAPQFRPSSPVVAQLTAPKQPTPFIGSNGQLSSHSLLTASTGGGHSQKSLDFQLSDDDEDVIPQPPHSSSSQPSRNEKVKQVMEYDKAGLLSATAVSKKASSAGNSNNVVMEEKKEAPEDAKTIEKKQSMLNTVDGPPLLNRKTNSNKEKRHMARKTSLVDDEPDGIFAAGADANDPILGTTIGGDGFLSADNKNDPNTPMTNTQGSSGTKLSRDLLQMFDRAAAAATSTPAPASNTAQTENPMQSIPSACILPDSNGDPVFVGCSSALKSGFV